MLEIENNIDFIAFESYRIFLSQFQLVKDIKYVIEVPNNLENQILRNDFQILKDLGFIGISNVDYERYSNYQTNNHHWTTKYCWNIFIPKLFKEFEIDEFDPNDFYRIENFRRDGSDLSYHIHKKNMNFTYESITDNIILNGDHEILRGSIKETPENLYDGITEYHLLYRGSHKVSKIINNTIDNDRCLFINCDSYAIPIIPILACYFKKIFISDTRHSDIVKDRIIEFNPNYAISIGWTFSYRKLGKDIIQNFGKNIIFEENIR